MGPTPDDAKRSARGTVAADPGRGGDWSPFAATAGILAELGDVDNLAGLGEWASKARLVKATGRSPDWFERNARAGLIDARLEVDEVHRRVRSVYAVADVRVLLGGAK